MTIVAIWRTERSPSNALWACSDSRISGTESMAGNDSVPLPLISHGPKIFPIHITAYDSDSGSNTGVIFRHSVGLAYAGSSLFAHNLYAAMCPILENLRGHVGALVSIQNIADLAITFLREFATGYARSRPREHPPISVAVFGYCLVEKAPVAIHLHADWQKSVTGWIPTIKDEIVDFSSADYVFLMGEHTVEIQREIYRALQEAAPGSFRRLIAPRDTIHDIIKREAYTGIGGTVQLFQATELGVQQYMDFEADSRGGPALPLRYLGFGSDTLSFVGPCWFSLPAVLYPRSR